MKEHCISFHYESNEMEEVEARFGLQSDVITKLLRVFESHPGVEKVLIYGSRAMGNYRPGSDIDLTLKGKQLEWNDLLSIELAIDELLLPYKVDLSLYDEIDNKDLIDHIDRWGVELN